MTEDRPFIRSHYNLMSGLRGELTVLCYFTLMPMHVNWVGARWQGPLFLLLSMCGGTRLRMTVGRGGIVPLVPCLCLCPHTTCSILMGPAADRAPPLTPCGVKIQVCNLLHGISKQLSLMHMIKTTLPVLTWNCYQPIPLFCSHRNLLT